jgi:hypothetical protein
LAIYLKEEKQNLSESERKMDSEAFQDFLNSFLVDFIRETFPEFHRLHMDNCPAHSSLSIFFVAKRNKLPAPAH